MIGSGSLKGSIAAPMYLVCESVSVFVAPRAISNMPIAKTEPSKDDPDALVLVSTVLLGLS